MDVEKQKGEKKEESVKVCVRCRPLLPKEKASNWQECLIVEPATSEVVIGKDRRYHFDHVFGQSSTQKEVYDRVVEHLVEGCFEGYNATVLAYGQTASGKTHTMGGIEHTEDVEEGFGIIPRVLNQIFSKARELESQADTRIHVGYLEVYNEEIYDLLRPQTSCKDIVVREDGDGGIVLSGALEERCSTVARAFELLEQGAISRATAGTLMNENSSRSHAIFTVTVTQQPTGIRSSGLLTKSKFHLVDLAGSERAKRTGAAGQRFKESVGINQGLLALGKVISALSDSDRAARGKRNGIVHVPYRESKLTRILQDSLGGNSRTVMIACVSPADVNLQETVNTLKYAARARNIRNKPKVNLDLAPPPPPPPPRPFSAVSEREVEDLRKQVEDLQYQLDHDDHKKGIKPQGFSARLEEEAKLLSDKVVAANKIFLHMHRDINTLQRDPGLTSETLNHLERMRLRLQQWEAANQDNGKGTGLRQSIALGLGFGQTMVGQNAQLQLVVQEKEDEILQLREELQNSQDDLKRDEEIFDQKMAELRRYYDQMMVLHTQNQELVARLEEAEALLAEQSNQSQVKTKEPAAVGGQTEAKELMALALQDQKEKFEEERRHLEEALEKETEMFQERQKNAETQLQNLELGIQRKEEQILHLERSEAEAAALVLQYEDRVRTLTHETERLRDELEAIEEHHQEKLMMDEQALKSAAVAKQKLETQLSRAAQELEALKRQKENGYQDRVARLQAQSDKRLRQLEAEKAKLYSEKKAIQAKMREEESKEKRRIEAQSRELRQLKKEMAVRQKKVQELEAANRVLKKKASQSGVGPSPRRAVTAPPGGRHAPAPHQSPSKMRLNDYRRLPTPRKQRRRSLGSKKDGNGSRNDNLKDLEWLHQRLDETVIRVGVARSAQQVARVCDHLKEKLVSQRAFLRQLQEGDGDWRQLEETIDSMEGLEADLKFNMKKIESYKSTLSVASGDPLPTEANVVEDFLAELKTITPKQTAKLLPPCCKEVIERMTELKDLKEKSNLTGMELNETKREFQDLAGTLRKSTMDFSRKMQNQHGEYEAKIRFLLKKIKDFESSKSPEPQDAKIIFEKNQRIEQLEKVNKKYFQANEDLKGNLRKLITESHKTEHKDEGYKSDWDAKLLDHDLALKEKELQDVRQELHNLKDYLKRQNIPIHHVRVSKKDIVEVPHERVSFIRNSDQKKPHNHTRDRYSSSDTDF